MVFKLRVTNKFSMILLLQQVIARHFLWKQVPTSEPSHDANLYLLVSLSMATALQSLAVFAKKLAHDPRSCEWICVVLLYLFQEELAKYRQGAHWQGVHRRQQEDLQSVEWPLRCATTGYD